MISRLVLLSRSFGGPLVGGYLADRLGFSGAATAVGGILMFMVKYTSLTVTTGWAGHWWCRNYGQVIGGGGGVSMDS